MYVLDSGALYIDILRYLVFGSGRQRSGDISQMPEWRMPVIQLVLRRDRTVECTDTDLEKT
jgi:hypothetical protein